MKITNITFLFTFTILCSLSFLSCGDDTDDPGSGNVDCNSSASVNNAVAAEAQAAADAVSAWGMDPSTANCEALQVAYQDYIEALKEVLDCARDAGLTEEYNSLISLTESSFDALIC